MFRDSSDGIEQYTTSVTCFINNYIDPNQKPWITGNIRAELKGRAAVFEERDSKPEAYKKYRYAI
jgi:hypothetical protein